jgi:hypothetical protein
VTYPKPFGNLSFEKSERKEKKSCERTLVRSNFVIQILNFPFLPFGDWDQKTVKSCIEFGYLIWLLDIPCDTKEE